ncbi:DUF3763 domain-containing protein, partial [Salmonella enterica subsp. enterica serovar Virginia]|nr:DUF3763 domain-containing protein [Salmonella enterica subsp. enterica serovar Virginia]
MALPGAAEDSMPAEIKQQLETLENDWRQQHTRFSEQQHCLFNTGRDLALLGRFYAEALVDSGIEFDLLFGPAYKGIPIATT